MANGDLTKTIEYDRIEVQSTWNIQAKSRKCSQRTTGNDGSKAELSRSYVTVRKRSYTVLTQ
jgi:hypothetical protein